MRLSIAATWRRNTLVRSAAFLILGISCTFTDRALTAAAIVEELTQSNRDLTIDEETAIDQLLLKVDHRFQMRAKKLAAQTQGAEGVQNLEDPDDVSPGSIPDDLFPTDPTDLPTDEDDVYDFPSYGYSRRSGLAEWLAIEVIYQTLMFYGVTHILKKEGTRFEFKIVHSKHGHFKHLTKVDVAWAIREFTRYVTAMFCGQGTAENFYKAFAQVPVEEIGLRFKYDGAIALLGNQLPKEPNQIARLGTRWALLQQLLQSDLLKSENSDQNKELKTFTKLLSDVVGFMTRLNKLHCYVDITPNPKEELKKRVVVSKFLNMQKLREDHYRDLETILKEVDTKDRAEKIATLRTPQFPTTGNASN